MDSTLSQLRIIEWRPLQSFSLSKIVSGARIPQILILLLLDSIVAGVAVIFLDSIVILKY